MRETVRLGEVGRFVSGGTPSRKHPEYFEGTIPWVSTPALNGGLLDETDAVQLITEDAVANSATKLLPPHSLLIGIRVGVGKTAVNTVPMCTNQDIVAITDIDETRWDIQYLCYAIQAKSAYLVSQKQGATITGITSKFLKSLEVRWLDVEAQSRCVFNLDSVKGKIEDCKTLLEKLDELVKSRFVEMFGGKSWPNKALAELAEIQSGLTKNQRREKLPLRLPYLRVANVLQGRLDLTEVMEIGLEETERNKTLLKREDLLFVEGNGSKEQIGRTAIWSGEISPCVHQNHIIRVRFGRNMLPIFALKYFGSSDGRNQIASKAVSTSGLYTLSAGKIKSLSLPVPPLALQQEFAAFAEQVDKLKSETQQAIEKLHTLYDSLAQEYFGS